MTIRSRLMLLLLPPLIAFLMLISFFFYYNWSQEILQSVVNSEEIAQKLSNAWLIILSGSSITLLLVVSTVFLIADRISKPVQHLNRIALDIAAGDYDASIKVKGPKEIVELAHTLTTMNECLVEHMSRLQENSLIRERLYGEYECALLLQHYMLDKVIDEFSHSNLTMRLISTPLSALQKGLYLKINRTTETSLALVEANDQGFSPLFQLNKWAQNSKNEQIKASFIECQFVDNNKVLRYNNSFLFPPIVWSIKNQQFTKGERKEMVLENRDMIFLYNSGLIEQFKTELAIENWFGRVLRHFAEDGLDTIQTMLMNELTFMAKKLHVKHNFKIICMQINLNESIN